MKWLGNFSIFKDAESAIPFFLFLLAAINKGMLVNIATPPRTRTVPEVPKSEFPEEIAAMETTPSPRNRCRYRHVFRH
jgi:hypothetical protein